MTNEQILELASEKFGIHYDRLDARFTDFARALESRVLAERKQEPVGWIIDWPDEPDLGHYYSEEANDMARSRPLFTHPAPDDAKEIDPALFQRLLHARSELGRTIADPMWADHAEVSKTALKRWHSTIDAAITRAMQDERASEEGEKS